MGMLVQVLATLPPTGLPANDPENASDDSVYILVLETHGGSGLLASVRPTLRFLRHLESEPVGI